MTVHEVSATIGGSSEDSGAGQSAGPTKLGEGKLV